LADKDDFAGFQIDVFAFVIDNADHKRRRSWRVPSGALTLQLGRGLGVSFCPGAFDLEVAIPEPGSGPSIKLADQPCRQRNKIVCPVTFRVAEADGTVRMEGHFDRMLAIRGKLRY
jgi:hypothetical protein